MGNTLADSCARSTEILSRWHSKIAAPPFPEGSCSFIINNVIPRRACRRARCPAADSPSLRNRRALRGDARVGHTWPHRVHTRSPHHLVAPPPLTDTAPRVRSTPSVTTRRDPRDLRAARRTERSSLREETATCTATCRLRRADPWTLARRRLAADSARSTSERTARPRAAARSSPARRPLVTPTYPPPRALPRSSSWCFHSSSQPPPPARVYTATVARTPVSPFCLPRVWRRGFRECARVCLPFSLALVAQYLSVRPVGLLCPRIGLDLFTMTNHSIGSFN